MASLGITHKSVDAISDGVVAASLAAQASDDREAIPVLAVLVHAAEMLDVPRHQLMSGVVRRRRGAGDARFVSEFLARPPHLRSIEVMGYEFAESDRGLVYLGRARTPARDEESAMRATHERARRAMRQR